MEATALIDRGAALPSSTGNLIDVVWFRFFCLDWLHICFIRHGVESLPRETAQAFFRTFVCSPASRFRVAFLSSLLP